MKKVLFILTIGLLSGIMFQSCKQSDEQLQTEVVQKIQRTVPNVSATVNNGVATLTGTVESQDTKMTVENLAKDVNGVNSVVNNVMVRMPEQPVAVNPDNAMRTNIENRLRNAGYNDVSIQVSNGEVVLTGAAKRSDLNRIMQIANESNPARVTNNINLQ